MKHHATNAYVVPLVHKSEPDKETGRHELKHDEVSAGQPLGMVSWQL